MSEEKRELSEVKGVTPNPKAIRCRDCMFRDKDTIKVGSKTIHCGVTKAECGMYQKPEFKPHDVMFNGADCKRYMKDHGV